MSVLYLLTSPEPVLEGTDAVFQEVASLQSAFHGRSVNLFPLSRPSSRFPRSLYGLHKLRSIRRLEQDHRLNHVYSPVPYFFPVLRLLRNPIVYTVTAGLDRSRKPAGIDSLNNLHRIVVSNERDADTLTSWGIKNHVLIRPGIATAGFVANASKLDDELTLLCASAPWESQQFDAKGIDVMLETVARHPYLKLILLWRGLLFEELLEKVARLGIAERVEIVNGHVNVVDYLHRAHGTILLSKRSDIVKSYPHSLIESLLTGTPVLVSDTIPMADLVRQSDSGVVVDTVSVEAVTEAVETLQQRLGELTRNAAKTGAAAFSIETMVDSHRSLYEL